MKTAAAAILFLSVLGSRFGMAPATAIAADSVASDWPQWRGPNRDGVAGPGPKLADAWPEGGPKLLWKSAPIPCGFFSSRNDANGGMDGGVGSVTVAGEKAFVYVHWRRREKQVAITTKDLENLGWREDLPDDLGKKIDAFGRNHMGPHRKRDDNLEALTKEFLATLDPQLVEKYGPWIKEHLKYILVGGDDQVRSLQDLAKVATLRGKEYGSAVELQKDVEKLSVHDSFFFAVRCVNGDQFDYCNHFGVMGNTYTDTVLCLSAATGKEHWRKEFPGVPAKESGHILASGTPAVRDGKCYASGSTGLYCLSVADGSVVWQAKTTLTHSSPLVTDGGVFLMLDGGLTAFDALTGKLLWTQPKVRSHYTSVVPWASGGKTLIVTYGGAYAATDGREAWNCYRGGGFSTPAISGDIMMDPNSYTMHAVKLTDGKAELLWTRGGGTDNCGSSSLIYQGYMYQPAHRYMGVSKCRDVQTGELKWQIPLSGQCTSTIAADGKIFYTNCFQQGYPRLMMFKATPEKFELLGIGSATDLVPQGCTPSIANGNLYVRLKDCVACYDLTAAGNPVGTPPKPAVADVDSKTTNYLCKHGGDIWQAISAVDKGDSLEITDKNGKVTTRKKSDIYDVIKPGMTWYIK